MGGVDQRLVLERGIGSLDPGDDVVRLDLPKRVGDLEAAALLFKRHRPEIAASRGLFQRVEVLSGRLKELLGLLQRDPALDGDAARRGWPLCGWAMSKFSRLQLPRTTSNGYPAGPVSWTRIAAVAPFSDAISYLYVQRP